MTCTFFGHSNTPESVKEQIKETVIDLIENHGADQFYVGNHGKFDAMAAAVLRELKQAYPNIEYRVVLAYLPNNGEKLPDPTVFPEGIESALPKYAINFRNKWMLDKADTVVAYITHDWGGAAQFVGRAKRKKKQIINLSGIDIEL